MRVNTSVRWLTLTCRHSRCCLSSLIWTKAVSRCVYRAIMIICVRSCCCHGLLPACLLSPIFSTKTSAAEAANRRSTAPMEKRMGLERPLFFNTRPPRHRARRRLLFGTTWNRCWNWAPRARYGSRCCRLQLRWHILIASGVEFIAASREWKMETRAMALEMLPIEQNKTSNKYDGIQFYCLYENLSKFLKNLSILNCYVIHLD